MYITRKLKFKNGYWSHGGVYVTIKDESRYTTYMMTLCDEANKITPTKFVSFKSDYDNNCTIKIKTKDRNYFNVIVRKFISNFGDIITHIRF